jgi:hypothetical protein
MPRFNPFGYNRDTIAITIPSVGYLAATGAVNLVLSKTLGYPCELERVDAVTTIVATTAGSRVVNVRKGTATGTIVGTITLALATQGTLGVVNAGTVTSAAGVNKFNGTDTLTVEFPSGTAFTAGGVDLILTFRILDQKDVV